MDLKFVLKALSFNSTGFNFNLFLHEHMHLRANMYTIQRELADLESFLIPAVNSNNTVCPGRPSGDLVYFGGKN